MEELNRDALLIYLKDLCVMESIVNGSKNKIAEIKQELSEKIEDEPVLKTYEEPADGFAGNDPLAILFILFGILASAAGIGGFCLDSGFFIFCGEVVLIFGIGCLIAGIVMFMNDKRNKAQYYRLRREYDENRKKAQDDYDREMRAYGNNVRHWNAQSDEAIEVLNADIVDIGETLSQAYAANIIPGTFRNIQGVYYLYDYLSTSNQGLSEALVQCNLEAIKSKLDEMIKLQSDNIVMQAQTNAKLDNITALNQAILQEAASAAKSAATAAQCAIVTAANSEITKKLAKKSLAYQRADFWL